MDYFDSNCRLLVQAMAGVSVVHHYLWLQGDVREDLTIWEKFLGQYNGRAILMKYLVTELKLYTASGGCGFGAYCAGGQKVFRLT